MNIFWTRTNIKLDDILLTFVQVGNMGIYTYVF